MLIRNLLLITIAILIVQIYGQENSLVFLGDIETGKNIPYKGYNIDIDKLSEENFNLNISLNSNIYEKTFNKADLKKSDKLWYIFDTMSEIIAFIKSQITHQECTIANNSNFLTITFNTIIQYDVKTLTASLNLEMKYQKFNLVWSTFPCQYTFSNGNKTVQKTNDKTGCGNSVFTNFDEKNNLRGGKYYFSLKFENPSNVQIGFYNFNGNQVNVVSYYNLENYYSTPRTLKNGCLVPSNFYENKENIISYAVNCTSQWVNQWTYSLYLNGIKCGNDVQLEFGGFHFQIWMNTLSTSSTVKVTIIDYDLDIKS